MTAQPACEDPRLYPDDTSVVVVQIDSGVPVVGMRVNAWEARQMATKLRQLATTLLRESSSRMC